MNEPLRKNSTRASKNKWGYRGVEWDNSRQLFRARIEPANGQRGRWLGRFSTAEQAAAAYDDAAREIYGDDAFLNFPLPGEKQTVQHTRDDGKCVNGHDLLEHGYERPDGRGLNCRACNKSRDHRVTPQASAE